MFHTWSAMYFGLLPLLSKSLANSRTTAASIAAANAPLCTVSIVVPEAKDAILSTVPITWSTVVRLSGLHERSNCKRSVAQVLYSPFQSSIEIWPERCQSTNAQCKQEKLLRMACESCKDIRNIIHIKIDSSLRPQLKVPRPCEILQEQSKLSGARDTSKHKKMSHCCPVRPFGFENGMLLHFLPFLGQNEAAHFGSGEGDQLGGGPSTKWQVVWTNLFLSLPLQRLHLLPPLCRGSSAVLLKVSIFIFVINISHLSCIGDLLVLGGKRISLHISRKGTWHLSLSLLGWRLAFSGGKQRQMWCLCGSLCVAQPSFSLLLFF